MKKERYPFVSNVIRLGTTGRCHCGVVAVYRIEGWYDINYHAQLQGQGRSNEQAARRTLVHSIKRQRKAGSQPCYTMSACPVHVSEAIDTFMGRKVAQMELVMLGLFPTSVLILIDRNETPDETYPSVVLFPENDIHRFLKVYEQGENLHIRLK